MEKIMIANHSQDQHSTGSLHVEALGRSDAYLEFSERLAKVARVDRPVLIVGERGTGKELAAARLHFLSARWQGPFITLNCAALAPALLESELFGHEVGAFTGAVAKRAGRFELADGGSFFLDEIGNMALEAQEKILRVVEYGVFESVGGAREKQTDVRIIGATNVDLPSQADKGKFKRDLLDRLSFEVLTTPPLRERAEDIELLADHFSTRMAMELGLAHVPEFSNQTRARLLAYPWPGNVRELKNVVERAVFRAQGARIDHVEFDPFASPFRIEQKHEKKITQKDAKPDSTSTHTPNLPEAIRELELSSLRNALEQARHNQKLAAELLGLTYNQFRGLYRKHKSEL